MATAEEVTADRELREAEQKAASSQDQADLHAAALLAAKQRLAVAIRDAAGRLRACNYEGGVTEKVWQGGMSFAEVAVWWLHVPTLKKQYFFSPSGHSLLVQAINGDEERRHHHHDVTLKSTSPAYHHAASENWLMGMPVLHTVEEVDELCKALDQLGQPS
jgi:hypothetical protein